MIPILVVHEKCAWAPGFYKHSLSAGDSVHQTPERDVGNECVGTEMTQVIYITPNPVALEWPCVLSQPPSIARLPISATSVKAALDPRRSRSPNSSPSGTGCEEITAPMNERDYPHIVELALPPGGFRARSDTMLAFHRERDGLSCGFLAKWGGRNHSAKTVSNES
jgi:hypothetical protein